MIERIHEVIRCAKLLELNTTDDNVIACMAAAVMCKAHENNLGTLLASIFINQSWGLLQALRTTQEYQALHIQISDALLDALTQA
ncbi:hypothetical protein [Vibrio coralliilyticus]|uniref:hypothetical protein n=1 Tax=Vibrio coralliilyticus TaxID=190893 RepID=UPI000BAAADF7|nr:hypothetical protein [Vibrio coralliilyticus]NOI30342.1 hypothetical protein [Vibrio coralliilyticus]NOI49931.1 hypothetical protein [Vibrio coralliilyticus]NOI59160.1 hypothetical protein [Vibrio coralliilyticus]PAT66214.1 hypothetical protein CKA27_20545 [Vibrio coralliilyticus]WFB50973.1 hypothetical protein P6988_25805 [Vibrio coralliilyticus]